MGGSKKKKKRGGGAGRRADHHSAVAENSEIITEELTALCAIFQEDCKVISESPPLIKIKLRPYSKDTGYEDSDVSAQLSVRCVQGYPYKCPKLQIEPEKGLSKTHADNLLSLLYDQANSNAREGRVMIYNLVEAAQEFLSGVSPQEPTHGSVVCLDNDKSCQIPAKEVTFRSGEICSKGPFVFSHLDLFSGSGELWQGNLEMEESSRVVSSQAFDSSKLENTSLFEHMKLPTVENNKPEQSLRLATLEEESEDETKSTDGSVGNGTIDRIKDVFVEGNLTESYTSGSDSDSESSSSESMVQVRSLQTMKKDLLLVHLLRLVCSPKGALADALPEIMTELLSLGIVSEDVRDMAIEPSSSFDRIYHRVFKKDMSSSKVSHFWKTTSDSGDQSSSVTKSRYLQDFEELQPLGHGGFGHVVLCKNKLDGRHYAVKKIRLRDKVLPVNDRILREVATLSRLQHQHVVRYYQAWYEEGDVGNPGITEWGSTAGMSSSASFKQTDSSEQFGFAYENKLESTYLHIQMEYCPRTLRQMLESYNHLDKELAWHLFRQIVEGLAHIHGQGIIHRDLTPSNIFFDARNDIKIGDFGLAKFFKLEQLDQDMDTMETIGISNDGTGQIGTYFHTSGTGQVGTYFYTAPEIEKGWPMINEKADMYSLGVVFFELWHPFETLMERQVLLSDLKLKGELPSSWVAEFPEQATLLRSLMSPKASDRPSAAELLKHAFPPQMEYEMLDNILRTIHAPENTSIRQKVVHTFFDEDKLSKKGSQENDGRLKCIQDDISSFIFTDVDTANRDRVVDIAREVYIQHGAKHLEILPMKILGDDQQVNRGTVKLLSHEGDMIEFRNELRYPFARWIIAKQKSFFRRYETSYVYRRAIGHSPPNRYLQGDFDIVGGATALTEAEIIKATMDILSRYFSTGSCDIHLNHGDILEAIWSWTGINPQNRQKVAELLSLLGSLRPQSSERKSKWGDIRRQLRQELDLSDDVVNRLQTVGLRFCGTADQALPRLRGALPADKSIRKALDEVSELFNFLRVWKIERHVFLDVLMPPTEYYHRNLYFQIYLKNDHNPLSPREGTLLAIGGRYDYLLQQMVDSEYKSSPPGAVGTSIALETVLLHSSVDHKFHRNDMGINILVCSRGGGGLLFERMELVAELWEENFKAEFVPLQDPSLTEQYEYANEHDIKCLVVITDSGVSQNGSVKVRHLELKKEKEVDRENLVKFLSEAMATLFRNPSIWS